MLLIDDILIVLGLIVFEVVNSIDNAIVNAHILQTMGQLWRKRFLIIGIITSVFLVRFLLPLFIVWLSVPSLSLANLIANFSGGSDLAANAINAQKPIISLYIERFLKAKHGVWFFGFAAVILVAVMYFAKANAMMMLAAAIGSAAFFLLYGLQETAESSYQNVGTAPMSDISKFIYLEVLDAAFSFDGVVGSFAFTINLLLIFIGIGIGAVVVRQLTVKGIDQVAKYRYLKNGAMTSIGFLGLFMLVEAFGIELPSYVPIAATLLLVGVAFWKSRQLLNNQPK